MSQFDFVAVDWGTSSFRAWAMGRDGAVRAQHSTDQGMGKLAPSDFAPALEAALARMDVARAVPVVACGMVGAAQGWIEAPYLSVETPTERFGQGAIKAPNSLRDVFILPGLKQTAPPNVMRGEETQIAGFIQRHPDFTGVVCLPGTHAKWVQITNGHIAHFRTAMTGEVFGLIAHQSVLRHSMGQDGWDIAAFDAAVHAALETPEIVATELFEIRADGLLKGFDASKAKSRLSGLLIGFELAATRDIWNGTAVYLIGASDLTRNYAQALACAGIAAKAHDATDLTLAGLIAAADQLLREPA